MTVNGADAAPQEYDLNAFYSCFLLPLMLLPGYHQLVGWLFAVESYQMKVEFSDNLSKWIGLLDAQWITVRRKGRK